MKQERIRLAGMTALTVLMMEAVFLTFPVKHIRLDGKDAWVLVSRVYVLKEDGDCVLLKNGKAVYLSEEKKTDESIYGRVLASSTKGLM